MDGRHKINLPDNGDHSGPHRCSSRAVLNSHELSVLPQFGSSEEKIIVGHHLLGQLYRDFPYIKQRVDSGKWPVNFEIPDGNVFEQL